MSWPLASFVAPRARARGRLRAGTSARGPSSRMVAARRDARRARHARAAIAFAPLPNVKPTTDIVLIAGYALGGAPGFAVGAVAAIASNVVFGQGPWTPWQMLAWGLVGLLGAALGALARRPAAAHRRWR